MKTLRQAVGDYLSLRRSLGFKLKAHERYLREFVSFLKKKRTARISTQLALQFATQSRHQQPAEWAARLSVVRGFAKVPQHHVADNQERPAIPQNLHGSI